ncbi:phage late control D family protein [Roseibium sediminis]|uniref:phage late control D family protein n=1 Tax=Roseibium sediminis TaxID=1775174 RepID=UPI00123D1148|nr:late control D family protein [Roseibium sediminis]
MTNRPGPNDNWKVDWKVYVGGEDRSSVMHPYLLSIGVSLKDGGSADTCRLSFNDGSGEIKLPEPGDSIEIVVKDRIIFSGTSDEPKFTLNKNGGSVLSMSGSGVDMTGPVKKPLSFHMDDASLGDVMRKAAELSGIRNMRIDPAYDKIRRDYWLVNRQSLMSLGDRFARELAGTFKFAGNEAVLAKRGTGLAPSGILMPTVLAEYGKNLISVDVTPVSLRRVFSSTKVIWFDQKTGQHREVEEQGEGDAGEVDAVNVSRLLAASEDQAREQASARNRESSQNRGSGRITIDLDPDAQPEGLCMLKGVRVGVDGSYRIGQVEHSGSPSSGSTTQLSVRQPQDGAGKDTRPTR